MRSRWISPTKIMEEDARPSSERWTSTFLPFTRTVCYWLLSLVSRLAVRSVVGCRQRVCFLSQPNPSGFQIMKPAQTHATRNALQNAQPFDMRMRDVVTTNVTGKQARVSLPDVPLQLQGAPHCHSRALLSFYSGYCRQGSDLLSECVLDPQYFSAPI